MRRDTPDNQDITSNRQLGRSIRRRFNQGGPVLFPSAHQVFLTSSPLSSPISSGRSSPMQAFVPPRMVRTTGSRRPVDKSIIAVNKSTVGSSQVTTDLVTVTFPCTIVGLRWAINMVQDGGTGEAGLRWAIVVVRDGDTVDTVGTSDGATFYNPEQNVLAYGIASIDNNTESKQWVDTTKTMRKMMGGDKLVFLAIGTATNTCTVSGIIQFFCKT